MKGLSNPLFSGHPLVGINPLLERDLLTKMGAHIHFAKTGISVTDQNGEALIVLTISLVDKNKLCYPATYIKRQSSLGASKIGSKIFPNHGQN